VENPLGYSLRSLLLKGEEPCPLILANGFLNHPESFIKIADGLFKKNQYLIFTLALFTFQASRSYRISGCVIIIQGGCYKNQLNKSNRNVKIGGKKK